MIEPDFVFIKLLFKLKKLKMGAITSRQREAVQEADILANQQQYKYPPRSGNSSTKNFTFKKMADDFFLFNANQIIPIF